MNEESKNNNDIKGVVDSSEDAAAEEGKKNDWQKEREELEYKYKRALADYQNLLKRTAAEREELAKFAGERVLHEILPVYDNLKLALAHADKTPNETGAIKEGVEYVLKQFKSALEGLGIEEVKTEGEKFNHDIMEAVDSEETEDEERDGAVAREIMAGYKLNGKVIRAARVAVYKLKNKK